MAGLGKEARSSTDGKGGKDIEMGPAAAGSKGKTIETALLAA